MRLPVALDFPFPDAALAYDCTACGYQCCSGPDRYGEEIESLIDLGALEPLSRHLIAEPTAC